MTTEQSIVALDIGGTEMKGAVFLGPTEYVEVFRAVTPRADGQVAIVRRAEEMIDRMLASAPGAQAVGLVVPGFVDDDRGVAERSENLPWKNVPFRRMLEDRTGLPVGFGHDVRAGGMAEREFGAARGYRDSLFMPIGTGISGAITIDGISVGNRLAGEIGHVDIGSRLPCACGGIGCLETVASGPSIARIYTELSGRTVVGAREVAELVRSGDLIAARVWTMAIDALAKALATYVSLLAPELIVIGGGVSLAGEDLLGPLDRRLRDLLTWQRPPKLASSTLGDLAACTGAALLARNALRAS